MARLAAVALGVGWTLFAARAQAQTYPTLHIIALSQRVDRASVAPGGVFHDEIHVRISERRERLDELILGTFTDCQIISNETVRTALPDGTDFVERITLQANEPGEAVISPAYIDALDPALRKPMRFSSNAVRVRVTGAPATAPVFDERWADRLRRLGLAVLIVAAIFAALALVVVLVARRPRRLSIAPRRPAAAPAPAAPAESAAARVRRTADAFAASRDQATLLALRAALFARCGVPAGATLHDALQMPDAQALDVRHALVAAETAAFGPSAERGAAGDELLAAVDALAAGAR